MGIDTPPPALPGAQSLVSTGTLIGTLSSQSSKLENANSPTNDPFRRAFYRFCALLPGDRLNEFQVTTYDQLCGEIMRMQREQEQRKKMVNLSRIQSFLEAMEQFGKVVEVFVNVSNILAFVWGPIKFLLLTASNHTEAFEALLDAYEQIGENLPLLKEYEQLFHHCPHMIQSLELMYTDILKFHEKAMSFFARKLWKQFFRSLWKNFSTQFGGILKSLARHKALIESLARLAQYKIYRVDIAEMKYKPEEHMKKLKAVKDWLAVGSQQKDDHKACQNTREKFPSTGRWLMKHEYVKEWIGPENPSSPFLWLTGMPGAGKTILASSIIDYCRQTEGFITAYFYCHYENGQGANTAVGVIRGLLDQLLDEYPLLLPLCHLKSSASGEPSLRSLGLAKQLLEIFCSTVPRMFIVVDGVDECEPYEMKQILETFSDIIAQCEVDEPGKLRVLFVSQDYSDIRRGIEKFAPKIIVLSPTDNEGDISTYVRFWVDRILQKHGPLNDAIPMYLWNLTVANSKGMFLYAKLVMENLYDQPTKGELLDAIQGANLPHGIEEVYARIVQRIKRTSKEQEWKKAAKLLGWMVCAQRQLTWRELQTALSLNLDQQSVDYDERRLGTHIYDICGSLVQVRGDRVSLVHFTAKRCIIRCIEEIYEPSIQCELATLCLQYLTFQGFLPDGKIDKQSLRTKMLEGHFAFQDYAVAKWPHHLNAFISTGAELMKDRELTEDPKAMEDPKLIKELQKAHRAEESLLEISHAIGDFLVRYEENFHDEIVPDCEQNCQIFKDEEFFGDLVALKSHVYKFQDKGFDSRHKISIKGLEAVLERNRELLEENISKMRKQDLESFRNFYDDERRFKCTHITCMYFSEGFKTAKERKKHVANHLRPYQCEVPDCLGSEGFTNSKDLRKHTRSFHPEMSDLAERFNEVVKKRDKAAYTCTMCGKSFTRKSIRDDHEKSHRGIRNEECEECGRVFTRKIDLTRHKRIHDRR